MVRHLYIMQDLKSGNCSDPVVATNIQEMKRSFALSVASGVVPCHIFRDVRVLEIGDLSFDADSNSPSLRGLAAPSVAFYGDDPDVYSQVEMLRDLHSTSSCHHVVSPDPSGCEECPQRDDCECEDCSHYEDCSIENPCERFGDSDEMA